jgi:hypothetical protein
MIVDRMLPYDFREQRWTMVTMAGHPDTAVHLEATFEDQSTDTTTWRRDAAYDCDAGLVHPRDADELFYGVRMEDNERSHRHDFFLSSDDKGQLVGRHEVLSFVQFDVWCGDGCKGFPIPWTMRRDVTWSFLSIRGDLAANNPEQAAINDRLARDEAALEQGPPGPPIERWIMRTVRSRIDRGYIAGMGPNGDGINVSLALPDSLAIAVVLSHLQATRGVLEARHETLYRTRRPDGKVAIVIHVVPDPAVFEAEAKH